MPSVLGVGFASTLFAIALWLSSQSAAVTSAMAGQIVLQGFSVVKMAPDRLRMISRCLAIVPAFIVSCVSGPAGMTNLLIFSQVALSLQLPFVVVPLLRFTSDSDVMGNLSIGWAARASGYGLLAVILVSDAALLSTMHT